MKKFSEFGITVKHSFSGDKIKFIRILDREIEIHGFDIRPSNYEKGNGKYLLMQISIDGIKHVANTGAAGLQEAILKIAESDFPFLTVIKKIEDKYHFT